MGGVTGFPVIYMGQGFSPKGDKERFVLPADIRKIVAEASDNINEMLVARHEEWPCLFACGTSYRNQLAEEIRVKHAADVAAGRPSTRARDALVFGNLTRVAFDNSGRFILPAHMRAQASITDGLYIHGTMDYFTLWSPEVLMAMAGDEWIGPKASCESYLAAAGGRARK
ncbi:MraZ protein [Novosphingobium sp. SG751A]|uniref:division/cell wall cluster transcriptional repressor MraZ n=1 Tax=Novosphingobium sp. SG751A TaxID=2587000 RepID=UPI0015532610|nr:MraZ protein [Novosphingobium sp. SG751A]